ncbi:hypothetical protein CPB83DRAFT_732896, partial [Crepidotus variabilis]
SSDIDKSRGRVYLLEGNLYYSPNSSRDILVPKTIPEGTNIFSPPRKNDGRLDYWSLDVASYLTPQWWTMQFGWLAFLDLSPTESAKEILRPTHIILHSHYSYPSLSPPLPRTFGYRSSHRTPRRLETALQKSWEWFSLWLALTSYSIACAQTHAEYFRSYPTLARIDWVNLLISQGSKFNIDLQWVDTLITSEPPNTVEMERFFELRKERNIRIIAKESPKDQQRRLSREKQPPTISARVFEWTPNALGEYECDEIDKRERADALGERDEDECRYDAVQNEWHICALWGRPKEGISDELQ